MKSREAFQIISSISRGSDPYTNGESDNHPENNPKTVLALCTAVSELQELISQCVDAGALPFDTLPESMSLDEFVEETEKETIRRVLEGCRFNKTEAAKRLGISFGALRYKLTKFGLE